jgi:hypothetical protein
VRRRFARWRCWIGPASSGLERYGAPLSIVQDANGELTVEARVMRGDGPEAWVEAFTCDAPQGERREIVSRGWSNPSQARQLERAGIALTADAISR